MQQFIIFTSILLIITVISATSLCKCPAGMCCSQNGTCGYSKTFCGIGCQGGPCWDSSPKKVNLTYSGRITWYNVGGGFTACGSQHGDQELIFALNAAQFDPFTPGGNPNLNTLCGKYIKVTGPHGTATLQLFDRCPGCPDSGLDLTPAAFEQVGGDLGIGVVEGTWDWA